MVGDMDSGPDFLWSKSAFTTFIYMTLVMLLDCCVFIPHLKNKGGNNTYVLEF